MTTLLVTVLLVTVLVVVLLVTVLLVVVPLRPAIVWWRRRTPCWMRYETRR